jgi:hypothetical protein
MDKFIKTASLFAVQLLTLFVANSLNSNFNESPVYQHNESIQTNQNITSVSHPFITVLPDYSLSIVELAKYTDKNSQRTLTILFDPSEKDHLIKFLYYLDYSKKINPGLSIRELIFPFHYFL